MTNLLVCLFDEICAVRVVAEYAFNYPDRAIKRYLWGVLQAHWVMVHFVKENVTRHLKFHPQMVMFILEIMVHRMHPEGVSAACDNVSTLSVTVKNLASSVEDFYYRLCALEATAG